LAAAAATSGWVKGTAEAAAVSLRNCRRRSLVSMGLISHKLNREPRQFPPCPGRSFPPKASKSERCLPAHDGTPVANVVCGRYATARIAGGQRDGARPAHLREAEPPASPRGRLDKVRRAMTLRSKREASLAAASGPPCRRSCRASPAGRRPRRSTGTPGTARRWRTPPPGRGPAPRRT
jgi:hypothetical protein